MYSCMFRINFWRENNMLEYKLQYRISFMSEKCNDSKHLSVKKCNKMYEITVKKCCISNKICL